VRFTVAARSVSVTAVASGYRAAQIARAGASAELAAHREFRERWGGAS
jgi:hypothetical protein